MDETISEFTDKNLDYILHDNQAFNLVNIKYKKQI